MNALVVGEFRDGEREQMVQAAARAEASAVFCPSVQKGLSRLRTGHERPLCVVVSAEADVKQLVDGIRDEAELFPVPVLVLLPRPSSDGCRSAYEALKPVLAKYEGQGVQFVKKHYPLESECNPGLQMGAPHYGSCEAAAAYEMAKSTPHLAKMDEWLFDNQQTLTKDSVREAAKEIAGITNYDERYEATLQTVRTDASLGKLLNVRGTPAIYINGKLLNPSIAPPAYYDALIDIELKKAK